MNENPKFYWLLHHGLAAQEILSRSPGILSQQEADFLDEVRYGYNLPTAYWMKVDPDADEDDPFEYYAKIVAKVERFELNWMLEASEKLVENLKDQLTQALEEVARLTK